MPIKPPTLILIILDVRLSDIDGVEVANRLRGVQKAADTPSFS